MKVTIGSKIFGLAVVLLMMMAIIAVTSYARISKVNDEVASIINYHIPLTDVFSDIGMNILEEEIVLKTIMQNYFTSNIDEKALEKALDESNKSSEKMFSEFAKAVNLADKAVDSSFNVDSKVEFAKFASKLKHIQKEYSDYAGQKEMLLVAMEKNESPVIDTIKKLMGKEWEDFNSILDESRKDIYEIIERSAAETEAHELAVMYTNLVVTIIAVIFGLLAAYLLTRGIIRPLLNLSSGAKAVEKGDIDVKVDVKSRDEVGDLTKTFNNMVKELRVKERIKDTFGKYIDPRIVEELISHADIADAGGEKKVMTVSFTDMKGFTAISERFTPATLVNMINEYFTLMSQPVRQNKGVIDKYIGDAVMAFYGPPFTMEKEHALLACFAALEQHQNLDSLREALSDLLGIRKDLPEIHLRTGIATGDLLVGNIGSDVSKSYTVMGNSVNLASRLEGVNKFYGTNILICEETFMRAEESIEAREIDSVRALGKEEPARIYELMGRKGALDEKLTELRNAYDEGLKVYRTGDWTSAEKSFSSCLDIKPDDRPSKVFMERIDFFRNNPPGDDWDAVWNFDAK